MKKLIIALVAMTSMSAFAAEYRVGVDTNLGYTSSSVAGADANGNIALGAEVAKLFGNIEAGLALGASLSMPAVGDSDFDLALGVVVGYYLTTDYTNAIFARFSIGFTELLADDAIGEENLLTWKIAAGKNIKLSDSVAWSPNVSFGMTAAPEGVDDGDTEFAITPVALSIYL